MEDIFFKKKIILGVCGGIAAYKACYLLRDLMKRGAEVKVVMTPSSSEFVKPLTFAALSQNEVITDTFPKNLSSINSATWHIDYALWADLFIIAPATNNTIAKISYGLADNALTTLVSAARSPVIIAPAADVDMYENKINKENLEKLESLGYFIVHAEEGDLASGLKGMGRLADINKIIDAAEIILSGEKKDLNEKKILVSAGPTFEDIDPVRFIGNRSSGKMGFSIAKAAFLRGADVTLISGPSSEKSYPEINLIKVRSADEMLNAVKNNLQDNDVLIMSAAVADYKPKSTASGKIKKDEGISSIELTENEDILSSLEKANKIFIGFALETENEIENAKKKLKRKNLDYIILNSLKESGSGFEHNTNKITIIGKDGTETEHPLMSKMLTANKILNLLNNDR